MMPDIEKVLKGLECCQSYDYKCGECPYVDADTDGGCYSEILRRDAWELLKAQEPVEPRIEETILSQKYNENLFINYYCGNCGEFLHKVIRIDKFCSQCGRAVKWE